MPVAVSWTLPPALALALTGLTTIACSVGGATWRPAAAVIPARVAAMVTLRSPAPAARPGALMVTTA